MSHWEWTPTDMTDVPSLAKGGGTMSDESASVMAEKLRLQDEVDALRAQVGAVNLLADRIECERPAPGSYRHREFCPSCGRADQIRTALANPGLEREARR